MRTSSNNMCMNMCGMRCMLVEHVYLMSECDVFMLKKRR